MPFLIGALLALAVGALGTTTRMDRDRAFYPLATIVIASYYVLFAVLGQSTRALVLELALFALFAAAAVLGFRRSLWVVVVALAVHGVQDFVHAAAITNPGMPHWWPAFCGAYDVAAAAFLAWLLQTGRVPPTGRLAGTGQLS
jgi:hypothetical protein